MTKLFPADEMPIKTSGRPSLLVLGFLSVQDEAATSSHALFHWIPPATFTVTVQTDIVNKSHTQLEGKYSLESTDPRESEIRAYLRP